MRELEGPLQFLLAKPPLHLPVIKGECFDTQTLQWAGGVITPIALLQMVHGLPSVNQQLSERALLPGSPTQPQLALLPTMLLKVEHSVMVWW